MPTELMLERESARIRKRTKEIRLSYHNDMRVLLRLIEKKRLKVKTYQRILDYANVLQETYPDLWDIQFGYAPNYVTLSNTYGHNAVLTQEYLAGIRIDKIYFIIKFPKITITNSKGLSMEIVDLFIRLPLSLDKKGHIEKFEEIQGIRTTLNQLEATARYAHSHLNQITGTYKFSSFCLGSGDISNVQSLLNASLLDIQMFDLFISSLVPYLEWESLEGVPYLKIQNVLGVEKPLPWIREITYDHVLNNLLELTKAKVIEPDLDWTFNPLTKEYEITDDNKLEEFLLKQTVYVPQQSPTVFYHKNAQNAPIAYMSTDTMTSSELDMLRASFERPSNYIIFKGEKIFLKLVEVQIERPVLPYYIHPKIKNHVKTKLEYIANKKEVENYAIRRLDTLNY